MANPSILVYLQAHSNYVWQDGDVYELPQTDTCEGAAPGASFGGLGNHNQPHQLLLDKINYLHSHLAAADSNVGVNGWYRIVSQDSNLGQIKIVEQWGKILAASVPPLVGNQSTITFNFPLSFTTACWTIIPYLILTSPAMSDTPTVIAVNPFNTLTNTLLFAGGLGFSQGLFNSSIFAIGWRALGY